MESTSFYMTLPSSTYSSDSMYPNNTASSFRITLPKTIYLRHKYEVALVEILYPHTWNTFHSKDDYRFTYTRKQTPKDAVYSLAIPRGYYKTVNEVVS